MEAQDTVYKFASGLLDPNFGDDMQKKERSRFLAVLEPCDVLATYEGAYNHMVRWLGAVHYLIAMLDSISDARIKRFLVKSGLAQEDTTVVNAKDTNSTKHGSHMPVTISSTFDLSIPDRAISYLDNETLHSLQVGELKNSLKSTSKPKSEPHAALAIADVASNSKGAFENDRYLDNDLPWDTATLNDGFTDEKRTEESVANRQLRLCEHVTNFTLLSSLDKLLAKIEMLGRWLGSVQSTKDFHTNDTKSADAIRSLHVALTSYGLHQVKLKSRDQAQYVVMAFNKLTHRDKKVVTLGNIEMWKEHEKDTNLRMDMSRFLSQTYGNWRDS